MHEVTEYALSTIENGVVRRGISDSDARKAALHMRLTGFDITEEKRPAAARGLCVAVGGLHRTWELVVQEPSPVQGIYSVTESAALAIGLSGDSSCVLLRGLDSDSAIVTTSSELTDLPELVDGMNVNQVHNRAWNVTSQAAQAIASAATGFPSVGNAWEKESFGPALRELLSERHARRCYTAY